MLAALHYSVLLDLLCKPLPTFAHSASWVLSLRCKVSCLRMVPRRLAQITTLAERLMPVCLEQCADYRELSETRIRAISDRLLLQRQLGFSALPFVQDQSCTSALVGASWCSSAVPLFCTYTAIAWSNAVVQRTLQKASQVVALSELRVML